MRQCLSATDRRLNNQNEMYRIVAEVLLFGQSPQCPRFPYKDQDKW